MAESALGLGPVELGMDDGIRAPGEFGWRFDSAAVALLRLATGNGVTDERLGHPSKWATP